MEIKLSVRQISREEFEKYKLPQSSVYFCKDCWFDDLGNIRAFPLYISADYVPFAYYEVIQDA